MRHRFEDSCNMSILSWKLYRKINFIRTWSSRKEEFLSEITSFFPLKFEYGNYFQFKNFHVPFVILQSTGFTFFAKTMRGSCVFCCLSCISFNLTSHLKNALSCLRQFLKPFKNDEKYFFWSCRKPAWLERWG